MSTSQPAVIKRLVGGPLLTTSYALIAPGRETVIIDAPRNAWRGALDHADKADAPVSLVIASHGHWDHITDLDRIAEHGIPIAGHAADRDLFRDPAGQRDDLPFPIEPVELDRELADGDSVSLGDLAMRVIHTPGHTPGSISLWAPDLDALFTGDTILKGGAGYLERPECDPEALVTSLRRVARLPESTTIYPGHGAPTTVGEESWLSMTDDPPTLIDMWNTGKLRWSPRQDG